MLARLQAVLAWLKFYGYNLFIGCDQLVNAIFGGYADETMSSHAYRLNRDRKPFRWLMYVYDVIFFWQGYPGHCQRAYEHEKERTNLPPEMRT